MNLYETKKLLVVLIIIAVIGISATGIWFYLRNFSAKTRPAAMLIKAPLDENHTAAGIEIPKEVTVYTGEVIAVHVNYILVRAASLNNFLPADTDLQVFFNDDTAFLKYRLPKKISATAEVITPQKETVDSKALASGQQVVVRAAENIRSKTAFTADQIKIIE